MRLHRITTPKRSLIPSGTNTLPCCPSLQAAQPGRVVGQSTHTHTNTALLGCMLEQTPYKGVKLGERAGAPAYQPRTHGHPRTGGGETKKPREKEQEHTETRKDDHRPHHKGRPGRGIPWGRGGGQQSCIVRVCVCVCLSVCMYVCMYVSMYVYMPSYIYIFIYIYINVYTDICTCVCVCCVHIHRYALVKSPECCQPSPRSRRGHTHGLVTEGELLWH